MQKILVIRFSSIGDIVLTSPIVRCLKKKGFKVHFLVKEKFYPVIESNLYIDKIHIFRDIKTSIKELSKEKFDYIVDLQNNYNSRVICWKLDIKNSKFPKLNIQKFLTTWLKTKRILPKKHIVDRYFEATKALKVENDLKGLDFFINESRLSSSVKNHVVPYIVMVLGGSYYTKKIPLSKLEEICIHLEGRKIVLLGAKEDEINATILSSRFPNVENLCGKTNLHESAYLIQKCEFVITSDTGLMHIAAAFKKKIYSLWGNTIPEFGMYPYLPHPESKILENNNLWCRPCSKLGFQRCPLIHFKCMKEIDISVIK